MYVGIDIGGTKTLVAAFSEDGYAQEQIKFPTPKSYTEFLQQLTATVTKLTAEDFQAGCVAAPGQIDRSRGIVTNFGNLSWRNVPLLKDVEHITKCPMLIENDAKLAAVSEAAQLPDYTRVLYVTISTGIGFALAIDGKTDSAIGDSGGHTILLEHRGKLVPWESFASGSAIVKRFGKRASDINDASTWKLIAHDLAPGFLELIATLSPDIIVVGGGVGNYLDKFHDLLMAELKRYEMPMLSIPPINEAHRPNEAVIYGCYQLAKEIYGRVTSQSQN